MKYFLSRETIEITWGQTVESSTIKVGKVINVSEVVPLGVLKLMLRLRLGLGLRLRLSDDGRRLDLDLVRLRQDIWPADHTGGGGRHTTGLTKHTARVDPGLQSGA